MADPLWFQSSGSALGFDWHSSGLTTVVTGVLKHTITPQYHGIAISGGKGKNSSLHGKEIPQLAQNMNIPNKTVSTLMYASRMSAKVDNTAVQDGYNLYHHTVFFDDLGNWTVVQQGMNSNVKMARRYHWISNNASSTFLSKPHSGIICDKTHQNVLDMKARDSAETHKTSLDLVKGNPQNLISSIKKLQFCGKTTLENWMSNDHRESRFYFDDNYDMPRHLNWNLIKNIYDIQPENYEELVSINGVGPSVIRALSLISQLIYGSSTSWKDPVQYSFAFAHGGKDGVPFPVDKMTFDKSIKFLRDAIERGEIPRNERFMALKRLARNLRIILPGYND